MITNLPLSILLIVAACGTLTALLIVAGIVIAASGGHGVP